ncbi:hypothetical protein ONS96_007072 [Cadophora gregata f. sp. sojae]|nr:hypothetical protein ONS96_007072 [Cadophora gregata f. sp. sojae]
MAAVSYRRRVLGQKVRSVIDDMELRIKDDMDDARRIVRFGTHTVRVNEIIRKVKARMFDYEVHALGDLISSVDLLDAIVILARNRGRLLHEFDTFSGDLRELSQSYCAHLYYGPSPGYKPNQRPEEPVRTRPNRRDSSPYIASRKAKPVPKPEPEPEPETEPVPGVGPGPKPIPAKLKSMKTAEWEGLGWPNTT